MRQLRSFIFSSSTLPKPPRPTAAFWVALILCGLVRFALEPLRDVPRADLELEDIRLLRTREELFIKRMPEPARVVVAGSSRTLYSIAPGLLAGRLGLAEHGLRNLSFDGGHPWDALVLFRRNPRLLEEAELVILDVDPLHVILNEPLPERYYRLMTLRERLRVPGPEKVRAVANWILPVASIRRPLNVWLLELKTYAEGGPTWESRIVMPWWHTVPGEEELREMFERDDAMRPETAARRTYENHRFNRVTEFALADLRALLERHGVRLLIHSPPLHPDYLAWVERNEHAKQAYASYLEFVESLRSPMVDVVTWHRPEQVGLSADRLLDWGHLDRRGAEIYSSALADRILGERFVVR